LDKLSPNLQTLGLPEKLAKPYNPCV